MRFRKFECRLLVLEECWDSETEDVFVSCCIFIVYEWDCICLVALLPRLIQSRVVVCGLCLTFEVVLFLIVRGNTVRASFVMFPLKKIVWSIFIGFVGASLVWRKCKFVWGICCNYSHYFCTVVYFVILLIGGYTCVELLNVWHMAHYIYIYIYIYTYICKCKLASSAWI